MPSTAQALVDRTKLHLLGNLREELNVLTNPITAGATSLVFTYPATSIAAGADIEIDMEVFRVISVSGQNATVIPAQLGSVAANHAASATITVNPRFYKHDILADLNSALDDLSTEGLFREVATSITFNAVVSGYDLAGSSSYASVIDVLEIRYQQTGPSQRFPVIEHFSLMRDMPTATFPSGIGLVIDEAGFPGLPLRVRYAVPYGNFAALSDTTTTVGIEDTATDLPPIGAAIRQMASREMKRSFLESQPDTRRATEVPPSTALRSAALLQKMWADGVMGERRRLMQRWPNRLKR